MTKKAWAVTAAVVALAIGATCITGQRISKKKSDSIPPDIGVVEENVDKDIVADPEMENSSGPEFGEKAGFEPLYQEGKSGNSMVGFADYENLDFDRELSKSFIDSMNFVPVMLDSGPYKLETGHQVYRGSNGKTYIVSGDRAMLVEHGKIISPNGVDYLREEGSGKRIWIALSPGEKEKMDRQWLEGQEILAGKKEPESQRILVDGFNTDLRYDVVNGKISFNLKDVATFICKGTYLAKGDTHLHIYPNEYYPLEVLTEAAPYHKQEAAGVRGGKYDFKAWNGQTFTVKIPLLNTETFMISAEDASRIFGWRMYSNGDALHIVSDPMNVTGKVVMYDNGQVGGQVTRLERDENGNEVMVTYDSAGNVLSIEPFSMPEEE